jgi:hypothetical protein
MDINTQAILKENPWLDFDSDFARNTAFRIYLTKKIICIPK